MKLTDDRFYVNKTKKYLLPLVKDFGYDFIDELTMIFKLGVGIGDAVMPGVMNLNNHLFILTHTKKKPERFAKFIKWLRTQSFFEFDYAYDDIVDGYQHMLVLRLPKIHKEKLDHFVNSRFSEMYPKSTAMNYFSQEGERFKILTKNNVSLRTFVEFINKEYDTEFTIKDWIEHNNEIEFPIEKKEEIFNYNLIFKRNE